MSAAWDDPRVARGMAAELGNWRRRLAAGEEPLGWKVGFGAAAANEMMNACRGMGLDRHDFVIAHEAYRRLGGVTR